jgi:hypothetical protein
MVGRVARQHLAADDTRALLDAAIDQLREYKTWSSTFDSTLRHARRGAPESLPLNFVWQDDLIEFWSPFTTIQRELLALYDSILEVNPDVAGRVEDHLDPPQKAQIEFATDVTEFFTREGFDRKQIAYDIRRLQTWHANFTTWLEGALRGLRAAMAKL